MWGELHCYRIAELQSVGPLVLGVSEFRSYSVTECIVAEWPRCRVAKLQSCTGTELHNCGVAESGVEQFRVAEKQSCRATGWQSRIFAEWLSDSAEGSQSCGAAELQKDRGGGG